MKNTVSRRCLLEASAAWAAAGCLGIAGNPAHSSNVSIEPKTLVELFTSQGCSSCPAADRLAGKLMQRKDVVVVSLNVDYWDYLGWKDTLAKPEFSKRQMNYAHRRGDGDVYTPQMVVNGTVPVVGSKIADVEKAIRNVPLASVAIELVADRREIRIVLPAGPAGTDATLWLMGITPHVDVAVARGENSGSSIRYHNVVRSLVPAGIWKGQALALALPRKAVMTEGCTDCLAVLQEEMEGNVIGLAQLKMGSV